MTEPTVLFFPGTHCDERVFVPLWLALKRRASIERRYVPLQWANSLDDMLALASDRLSDAQAAPVHLVGFSLGGYIASLTAIANPQKVASLTLIGYSPEGLTDAEMKTRRSIINQIQRGQFTGISKARAAQFLSPAHPDSASTIAVMQEMADDLGANVLKHQFSSTTPRQDLSQTLLTMTCPTHFIVGEHDQIAKPEQVQRVASQRSSFQFHSVSDAGHMLPLEQADWLANYLLTKVL